MGVEHLLLALLDQERGLAASLLSKGDISVEALKLRVQRELEKLPARHLHRRGQHQRHRPLQRLLDKADDEAKGLNDDFVSVEHLLLAMLGDSGQASRILKEFGLTRDRLMRALQEVRGHQRVTLAEPPRPPTRPSSATAAT